MYHTSKANVRELSQAEHYLKQFFQKDIDRQNQYIYTTNTQILHVFLAGICVFVFITGKSQRNFESRRWVECMRLTLFIRNGYTLTLTCGNIHKHIFNIQNNYFVVYLCVFVCIYTCLLWLHADFIRVAECRQRWKNVCPSRQQNLSLQKVHTNTQNMYFTHVFVLFYVSTI